MRGTAASGPQLPSSLQSRFNLVNLNLLRKFKFKFTCKLIPIISSFNVLSQISKLKLEKSRDFELKTLPRHVHRQQTRGGPGRGTVTSQSNDLGLAASLTWSCYPGVTVFLVKVIVLKPCDWQPRAWRRRPCRARASHMLGLAASLTWSCRSGVTVLALQQHGAPLRATDCRRPHPKVFSCYADAMMFAMK